MTFELQAPTQGEGYSVTPSTDSVFVGEDPVGGGDDFEAAVTDTLQCTGEPQANQG